MVSIKQSELYGNWPVQGTDKYNRNAGSIPAASTIPSFIFNRLQSGSGNPKPLFRAVLCSE